MSNAKKPFSDLLSKELNNKVSLVLLLCITAINFLQHFGHINSDIQGKHTWRQAQTLWNVRNFVRYDNNILNPRVAYFNRDDDNILRYEFPLMQWIIAQPQRWCGESILLARSIVFVFGVITLITLFQVVYLLVNSTFTALITTVLFQYSPLFYYYTIAVIPDMAALSFASVYILFILQYRDNSNFRKLLLAVVAFMLASLCKLPFVLFGIVSLTIFVRGINHKSLNMPKMIAFILVHLLACIPVVIWYTIALKQWTNNPVIGGSIFSLSDLNEVVNILKYHFEFTFPENILSPIAAILPIIGITHLIAKRNKHSDWLIALIAITLIYWLYEFIPINVVHDYYLLPIFYWVYLLLAFGVHITSGVKYVKPVLIFMCFYSIAVTPYQTANYWKSDGTFNPDVLNNAEALKNAVPQHEKCIIVNDHTLHIFAYKIDKMGYVFYNDYLPVLWIEDMIKSGVKYMYSDSYAINHSEDLKRYIDSTLLIKNSVYVYKLKLPAKTQ